VLQEARDAANHRALREAEVIQDLTDGPAARRQPEAELRVAQTPNLTEQGGARRRNLFPDRLQRCG